MPKRRRVLCAVLLEQRCGSRGGRRDSVPNTFPSAREAMAAGFASYQSVDDLDEKEETERGKKRNVV